MEKAEQHRLAEIQRQKELRLKEEERKQKQAEFQA